jgi:autotransporter-associated beta strand protein
VVAGPGSLGTGNLTFGVQIGADTFSGGSLTFNGGGTYAGNVNQAFPATVNTNGNDVTFSGVISGPSTLTKTGAGALTLSGANTYSGNTIVGGGTLLVANTAGSGTGAGAVTVNSGATLGGTGTIDGAVTVNNGATLRPGAAGGTGQLTLRGKATLGATATFTASLAGTTAGTQYGQLVIAAGGSINLGSATFAPTLNYTPTASDKLFLVDNQNLSGGLSGTFNTLNQGDTFTFGNGTTAQISYFGNYGTGAISGGNDLVLYNFNPVPEPATVLGFSALALAGGGMVWRRRKANAPTGAE